MKVRVVLIAMGLGLASFALVTSGLNVTTLRAGNGKGRNQSKKKRYYFLCNSAGRLLCIVISYFHRAIESF